MNQPAPHSLDTKFSAAACLPVTNSRRWSIVVLLLVAAMINYFDRATISFALPLISKELHLDDATKGVLLSAFFWSYALMQIPVGWASDRFNLRWLYAGAFALWSVAQGLIGMATSLTALICFRVLLGFGESIYLPGGSKIVSLLFQRSERGLPVGLFDSGTRTGLVLEGFLVPWLLVHYGWRATFMVVGFSALLWLLPWLLLTPARLQDPSPSPDGGGTAAGLPASRENAPAATFGESVLAVLTNRNLLGSCLGFFFFDYYWYLLMTWLPSYLVEVRHFTLVKAGLGASLPFLVFGLSEPVGGWIADTLIRRGWDETRARKGIVTIAFLTGILLIPAARVSSPYAAVALLAGASLVGLSTGNQLVILQSRAPAHQIGLWTGIYNFFGNIAGILAPLVTGLLVAKTGSYSPAFYLAVVMLAAAPLSYWFIVGDLKSASSASPEVQS